MIIAGAGVAPSAVGTTYDGLVHMIDVVPTALASAGGQFASTDVIDGVNLLPYINGETQGPAHEVLWMRGQGGDDSAIRKGDWKLMYQPSGGFRLFNVTNDIGETTNLADANPQKVDELKRLSTDYEVQMDKPRYDLHAPGVNDFDEFCFREDAFPSAAWSTGNAWVNNQTGATATMKRYDGYANGVLVFRNKAAGSYTLTNDMRRQGGQEMMANQIRLENRPGALNGDGTATINGEGVLLANSLAGAAPEVRLDATISGPNSYTYDVALELQLYDDLTITGNGNQRFALSGGLREYRPGRSVTKTGSAQLAIGGGVDLSGTLDLQGGEVELTDSEFRGNLVARSGVTLRIGPAGIVPADGGNQGPPLEIVMSGLDLNFDAALDPAGDAEWTDVAFPGPNQALTFAGGRSPVDVSSTKFPGLTKAYRIPQSGGASGLNNHFEDNVGTPRSHLDATFEVVFNVTNTSAGGDQVIFEAGGEYRGVSFVLNNNTLTLDVDGDSNDLEIDAGITAGWHHAVGVIDLKPGDDTVSLYLDNVLIGSLNGNAFDWAGGNAVGIGAGSLSTTGVSPGSTGNRFHGDVASARFYADTAFGAAEVNQNYDALSFVPGNLGQPAVALMLQGDWTLEAGATLELDLLDAASFDSVAAAGSVSLAGKLVASASDGFTAELGDVFTVVTGATVNGGFSGFDLPSLADDQMWQVQQSTSQVSLLVTLAGDYNGDGQVDAADYTVWRDAHGLCRLSTDRRRWQRRRHG